MGSNKGTLGNTQHASGLVSLVKICKSIQAGTIPGMVRTGKLNPFITDAHLALNFAYQPTKVEQGALIGISAAGWGGVNSHVVVQVPPTKLLRKTGKKQPKYHLRNETLSAPRKSGPGGTVRASTNGVDHNLDLVISELGKPLDNGHVLDEARTNLGSVLHIPELDMATITSPDDVGSALDLVIQGVEKILGCEDLIVAETDLRAAGLDSARFVRLAHSIKSLGKGFYLP